MKTIRQHMSENGILIFQMVVLLFLFLKANPLVNSLLITDILMVLIVAAGALFFAFMFWKHKDNVFKNKLFITLYLFVASYLVTIILNYKYAFMSNVKDVVWFVIQVATLYISTFYLTKEKRIHNFYLLAKFYVIISGIFAILSIPFVFLAIGGVEEYGKWGFLSQRLFGLYRSPNYGALYCVVSIFLSLGIIQKKRSDVKYKWLYIVNIIANFLYVIYSGSNTGKVVLFTSVIVWFLLELLASKKAEVLAKKTLVYICLIVLLFNSFTPIKTVTAQIIKYTRIEQSAGGDSSTEDPDGNTEEDSEMDDTEEDTQIDFERTDYVEGEELGNGRVAHWKQALKVYPNYALFGTTMRGYMNAVTEVFPETAAKQKVYTIENDFVSLLACTGTVGFVIFMVFMFMVLGRIVNIAFKIFRDKDKALMSMVRVPLILVIIVAVSALFTDAIIFTNVVQSAVFWLSLGYFLNIDWVENV